MTPGRSNRAVRGGVGHEAAPADTSYGDEWVDARLREALAQYKPGDVLYDWHHSPEEVAYKRDKIELEARRLRAQEALVREGRAYEERVRAMRARRAQSPAEPPPSADAPPTDVWEEKQAVQQAHAHSSRTTLRGGWARRG